MLKEVVWVPLIVSLSISFLVLYYLLILSHPHLGCLKAFFAVANWVFRFRVFSISQLIILWIILFFFLAQFCFLCGFFNFCISRSCLTIWTIVEILAKTTPMMTPQFDGHLWGLWYYRHSPPCFTRPSYPCMVNHAKSSNQHDIVTSALHKHIYLQLSSSKFGLHPFLFICRFNKADLLIEKTKNSVNFDFFTITCSHQTLETMQ